MAQLLSVPLPDFLEESDGEVRVRGHRITLYQLLTAFNEGRSPEAMTLQFPTLKAATAYKVVGFYLDNQPQVDKFLTEYRKSLDEHAAHTANGPSKAELLRRLEQIRLKAHNAANVSH